MLFVRGMVFLTLSVGTTLGIGFDLLGRGCCRADKGQDTDYTRSKVPDKESCEAACATDSSCVAYEVQDWAMQTIICELHLNKIVRATGNSRCTCYTKTANDVEVSISAASADSASFVDLGAGGCRDASNTNVKAYRYRKARTPEQCAKFCAESTKCAAFELFRRKSGEKYFKCALNSNDITHSSKRKGVKCYRKIPAATVPLPVKDERITTTTTSTEAAVTSTEPPSSFPTLSPSTSPTQSPSSSLTLSPSTSPTQSPSSSPTLSPSTSPTKAPTAPRYPGQIYKMFTEVTVGALGRLVFWEPPILPNKADPITDYQFRLRKSGPVSLWIKTVEFARNTADNLTRRPDHELFLGETDWGLVPFSVYFFEIRAKNAIGGWSPWGSETIPKSGTTGTFNTFPLDRK